MHVEREVRHALVFGSIGVGSGHEHAPVAEVGQRVPHLLSVHEPLIAVSYGLRGEAGKVGSCPRLAEQLAPLVFAGKHRAQESALLLVGAVSHDGRTGQGEKERPWISGSSARLLKGALY